MKVLVVGLGVQGKKRINILNKKQFYASVDPKIKKQHLMTLRRLI